MFSTDKFNIKSFGNSIFRIEFFQGADIDLTDAKIIHENLTRMSGGEGYCILLNALSEFTTTPESREYVANKVSRRIAFAMVTKSIANRLVGNFFIQFNKPVSPTKLFSNEEEAIKWLMEQKAIHDSSNK